MSKLIFLLTLCSLSLSLAEVNVTDFESFPLNPDVSFTTIKVTTEAKFILVSKSNPSTGYNWYVANGAELQASNLIIPLNINEANTGEYEARDSTESRVGSGGYTFLKFQTLKQSGVGTVLLEYRRPWEERPIKKIQVDVQILDFQ